MQGRTAAHEIESFREMPSAKGEPPMKENVSCQMRGLVRRRGVPGVHFSRVGRLLAASAAALLLTASTATALAAGTEQVTNFGANPGNLHMYRYAPDNLQGMRPLVVALHGCNQSATDYDDESG